MVLKNKRIGVAMTGSFCTYTKAFEQIDRLLEEGAILQTIFSDISQHIKCRFGKGEEFVKRAHDMTGNEPMKTIEEAEIIGPTGCLDILILMPCTGNTMAKLANGITDTPVLMAAKAQLRNEKPVVISMASNDALGMNLKNIGHLLLATLYARSYLFRCLCVLSLSIPNMHDLSALHNRIPGNALEGLHKYL